MRIQFSEDQLLCGAQVIENGQYVYDEDDYISIQDNQQDLFMDIHKKLIGEKFPEIKYLHLYPELIEQYTDNGLT